MIFRLDWIFQDAYRYLGLPWVVVGVATLLAAATLRVDRALVLLFTLMIVPGLWLHGVGWLAGRLRWWFIGIIGLRLALHVLRSRPPDHESRPLHRWIWALVGLALLSALWSADPRYSLTLAGTLAIGLGIGFVATWRLLDSIDLVALIARWAIWVALVIFGAGLLLGGYEYVTGSPALSRTTGIFGRFGGLFWNANASGVLAAILFPIVLAAPASVLGAASRLRGLATVLTVATVVLSGSRSAMIGMLMAVIVIGIHRYRGAASFLSGLLVACVITMVVVTPPEQVETTALNRVVRIESLSTLSDRTELWRMGIDAGMERPALGLGWGQSRLLGRADAEGALETGNLRGATNLHSAHIQLFVDLGLLGLGTFWIICTVILRAIWTVLRAPSAEDSTLHVVVASSVLAMLGDSFVHGSLLSVGSPAALIFWTFAAIVVRRATQQRLKPDVTMPAVLATAMAKSHVATRRAPNPREAGRR